MRASLTSATGTLRARPAASQARALRSLQSCSTVLVPACEEQAELPVMAAHCRMCQWRSEVPEQLSSHDLGQI